MFLIDNNLSSKISAQIADFYHLLNKYGHPPKVRWIRVGNVTINQIIALLRDNNALIQDFLLSLPAGILELY